MKIKLLILLLIYSLMVSSVLPAEKRYIIEYSWKELFSEPFETIYIIMKDGKIFKQSNQDEIKVNMDLGRLEKGLKNFKSKNYSIKDIAVFVHNHLKVCRFSYDDHKIYRQLKECGFKGLFLVYCHSSKKTYDIEDKNK